LAAATGFVLTCVILGTALATGAVPADQRYTIELPLELTAAFGITIGIVAAVYPHNHATGRGHAFLVAAVGAVVGCFYWYFSYRLLAMRIIGWQWGVLLPDVEIQTALCGAAAGISAMLVAFTRRTPATLASIAVLCLSAVALPSPLFNHLYDNQELTVAFATPIRPDETAARPPRVITSGSKEFDETRVAAHVLEALRSSGLPGEYRVTNLYRIGAGKRSLQIIVVSAPVASRALLPEPDGTEVIYVQKPDGWESIPPRAPTLRRSIEISEPEDHGDWLASFAIVGAPGIGLGDRMR